MTDRLEPTLSHLIAAAADGELTADQVAELERRMHGVDERRAIEEQIKAHRRLRQSIYRVMSDTDPAPAALRDQIQYIVSGDRNESAEVAGRIEPSTESVNRRQKSAFRLLFASPYQANALAVAATLALVVGAVLFGIFGRTIDDVAPRTATDLIADAARFADREHGECARDLGKPDFKRLTMPEAASTLSQWLGAPVEIFDLSAAGYEFIGAAQADMPVPARSGHLVYRKIVEPGQRAPVLSVFVVRDRGRCGEKLCEGLDRGTWGCVSKLGVKCQRSVLRGTDGELIYFLVCCDSRDIEAISHQIQLASVGPLTR